MSPSATTVDTDDGASESTSSLGLPDVDLLDLRSQLDPGERSRLDAVEAHLRQNVRAQTIEPWNREEFAPELLGGLGELGLGQIFTDGSSQLLQGLIHTALARNDLSLATLIGIHNELIVGTLDALGSDEQKRRWLPRLKRLDALGAFCLTEPEHGSDIAGGLATTAERADQGWIIRGSKRWIGAGTLAEVALVWARDVDDDQIKCFLMPTDTPGFHASKIRNKVGLRLMQNADITFDAVRLPAAAQLPGAVNFAAANELLKASRAWVGWEALGAQQAVLDILRRYTLSRDQFGRPLAGFQLIQQTLAEIAGNTAATAGLMSQMARLQAEGNLAMSHAAMAKSTATRLARSSAALGRDAMGGNGIVSDFEMAKVMNDVEAIHTYEGSYSINSLIVGRSLTGISAFA